MAWRFTELLALEEALSLFCLISSFLSFLLRTTLPREGVDGAEAEKSFIKCLVSRVGRWEIGGGVGGGGSRYGGKIGGLSAPFVVNVEMLVDS